MTDEGVVVLGIPIPSSSPLFLSIVAVHVAAGLICTVAGVVAMLAPKRSGRHPSAGRSPHRPNPLGLHRVAVREVAGTRLRIGPIEAIDETPVVDIKPVI